MEMGVYRHQWSMTTRLMLQIVCGIISKVLSYVLPAGPFKLEVPFGKYWEKTMFRDIIFAVNVNFFFFFTSG